MRFFRFIAILVISFPIPAIPAAAEEVFTISTSYHNLLSNFERNGMLDRLFTELFRRLDIPMDIVFTDTNKSLTDVNRGILDAEMNRIAGMEEMYPNLVRVPEATMIMHFVAFSKQDLEITGWKSLESYNIGMVKGWKILELNTEDCPSRILTPTEKELFNMLRKDRLDIALYSKLTGYAHIKEEGYEDIKHLEPPLESREMFLYVNKKHAELAEKIADVLREMKKDGTYQRIVNESMEYYLGGVIP